jgi:septal ring-binding cell division protein DamX
MLKASFLLLLVAFGAVMFAAGALAPANVKAPLEHAAAGIAATLSGGAKQAAATARSAHALAASGPAAASASAASSSGTTASNAAASVPASSASAPFAASTPLASLLVPVPPPANGHYALQAATFASSDAAALFADTLAGQGFKAVVVPVTDSGQPFVVAVGDYPSAQAASGDQLTVGRSLKSVALPPVILLPQPAH